MSNKKILHTIFNDLIEEIEPQNLINEQCSYSDGILKIQDETYDLTPYKKVHLLGSGKAVIPMAKALQSLLGDKIWRSLLVGAYNFSEELANTDYLRSSHPLPSEMSIEAAAALQERMRSLGEDDFFIYLLSGGNSALVELPEPPITLDEFKATTSLMLRGGMPIEKINCVRKHLSQVKGGKLAKGTKAKGVVLVLSDVIGDDLHAIGSAPLYYDTTSFSDAISYLREYTLLEKLPTAVHRFLHEGSDGLRSETPKSEPEKIRHLILGSNALVLEKAKILLDQKKIPSTIASENIEGDTQTLAQRLVALAENYEGDRHCFIFGGEATVNVRGEGRGGRNQHLALSVLQLLTGEREITFLSAATDGVDGNSEAAGALIDMHSRVNALTHGIDPEFYLETFNSNAFFAKTGELLRPGATHNNLLDIVMILVEPKLQQGEDNG